MPLLNTQQISGAAVTFVSAGAGGDTINGPDAATMLWVKNGGGAAITVTISDPGRTPAGNSPSIAAVSVPNGGERLIPVSPFNADSNGVASISYSGVTSVTVAAVRR